MDIFRKQGTQRAIDWEAAGLRWLAQAQDDGGARVAQVVSTEGELVIERIRETPPSRRVAGDFGAALAVTHAAGASAFGAGPAGWSGPGLQGPAGGQIELALTSRDAWGQMWARDRVMPLVGRLKKLSSAERAVFEKLAERLSAGEFDGAFGSGARPARVHGDLWSGNVLWGEEQAVLIDPAAYGGHPEDDLAALALFGAPHLSEIIAGYQQVTPLEAGWEDRVELHQLHLLLLHAVLFGGGYVRQSVEAARRYV